MVQGDTRALACRLASKHKATKDENNEEFQPIILTDSSGLHSFVRHTHPISIHLHSSVNPDHQCKEGKIFT